MKIVIYALHLGFGGVEKYISTIANILVHEYEVEIVSTYKITEKPAFYIDDRVKITYLMSDDKPNKVLFLNALKGKKVFQIIKEGGYALKILGTRYYKNFKHIHNVDCDVIISTRIFHNQLISKYANKDIIKITGEHNHPHGNEKYMQKVVKSCQGFNYFIPISKQLCKIYEGKLPTTTRIMHIPFCIEETPDIGQREFSRDLRLINVGRISEEKGCIDLIHMLKRLRNQGVVFTMDIIGSGSLENKVCEEIHDLGLSDVITLHGFQNKDYINSLYKDASMYVMTSYTESFGIVLLEAMAYGVPCIAFDSAEGACEIITNQVDGYLIKNRDLDNMCNCIKHLSEHREELQDLSKMALQKAAKYSYEKCKEHWLSFMHEIKPKGER